METMTRTTNQVVTDAKTRELNAKAKLAAAQDMAKAAKVVKNINTGKVVEGIERVEDKKVKPVVKKEPKVTFVSALDTLLQAGGTWKELIDGAEALNVKMNGHIKYNTSVLKAHIKFRTLTSRHADANYLKGLVVTENGIEAPKEVTKKAKK